MTQHTLLLTDMSLQPQHSTVQCEKNVCGIAPVSGTSIICSTSSFVQCGTGELALTDSSFWDQITYDLRILKKRKKVLNVYIIFLIIIL